MFQAFRLTVLTLSPTSRTPWIFGYSCGIDHKTNAKKKKLNLDGMARFSHGVNKERSVEKLESVPVQYELLGWLHPPSP